MNGQFLVCDVHRNLRGPGNDPCAAFLSLVGHCAYPPLFLLDSEVIFRIVRDVLWVFRGVPKHQREKQAFVAHFSSISQNYPTKNQICLSRHVIVLRGCKILFSTPEIFSLHPFCFCSFVRHVVSTMWISTGNLFRLNRSVLLTGVIHNMQKSGCERIYYSRLTYSTKNMKPLELALCTFEFNKCDTDFRNWKSLLIVKPRECFRNVSKKGRGTQVLRAIQNNLETNWWRKAASAEKGKLEGANNAAKLKGNWCQRKNAFAKKTVTSWCLSTSFSISGAHTVSSSCEWGHTMTLKSAAMVL